MEENIVWKRLIYQEKDYGDFYLVSNTGEIKGIKTGKIRSKNINHEGYYFVSGSLGSRENKITFKVHKAVAETFLPNPDDSLIINHKDGNKLNNNINNLEWCTYQENNMHAIEHNLTSKNDKLICMNTKEVFNSVSEACKWCGLSRWSKSMYEYLKRTKSRKSAGKHPITKEPLQWMYYKDYVKLYGEL